MTFFNSPAARNVPALEASDVERTCRRIREAKAAVKKLERRQCAALASGGVRGARRATSDLLTTYDAKLISLCESVARYSRRTGVWVTDADLLQMARTISAVRAPEDEIIVRAVPKSKGTGFRVISEYGLADSARQRLVQRALSPLLKASEVQFGRTGYGRSEAVQRVADGITCSGHEWVVVCDLRSFFSSVSREWLRANLPIGERITASVVLAEDDRRHIPIRHEHPSINVHMEELANLGRLGLPQGARTSSVVGTHVVASVLEGLSLSPGVMITVYVDDFVITAPTRAEALRAFDSLRDVFSRHPAGTFAFSDGEPAPISDGFRYLGYEITLVDGVVSIGIPARAGEAFLDKLLLLLDEIDCGTGESDQFRRWFKAWWAAHSVANNVKSLADPIIADLTMANEMFHRQDPDVIWALNYTIGERAAR